MGLWLVDLYEAYITNMGLIRSLEPFKKFSVGGGWRCQRLYGEVPEIIWWWSTVSLVFCFGPKLWFRTWDWDQDQAEQKSEWSFVLLGIWNILRFGMLYKTIPKLY